MADNRARNISSLAIRDEREQLRQKIIGLGGEISVPFTTFSSHWLFEGEQRLDAGYYARDAYAALRVVEDCGYESRDIGRICRQVYYPERFKRIYAKTEADGIPFLTASMMSHFRPAS